jgi:hypothetical protein
MHSVLPTPALSEITTVRREYGQIAENARRGLSSKIHRPASACKP